jgi:adenylate kinase
MLRKAAKDGSALGKEAQRFMDQGELVPDPVIIGIVEARLSAEDCARGFLLDGFPRTVAQAEALEALLERQKQDLDAAVSLKVPKEDLIARLSGRRTCKSCGTMYHIKFDRPKKAGICDRCAGELYQRADDDEETIAARMEVYERQAKPLEEYYRDKSLLREIHGAGDPDDVFREIVDEIERPQ